MRLSVGVAGEMLLERLIWVVLCHCNDGVVDVKSSLEMFIVALSHQFPSIKLSLLFAYFRLQQRQLHMYCPAAIFQWSPWSQHLR